MRCCSSTAVRVKIPFKLVSGLVLCPYWHISTVKELTMKQSMRDDENKKHSQKSMLEEPNLVQMEITSVSTRGSGHFYPFSSAALHVPCHQFQKVLQIQGWGRVQL